MSEVHFVIPGIGINVNTASFPPEIADIATSLYLECGKTVSRRRLVHKVLERLGGDFPADRQLYGHAGGLSETLHHIG